MARRLILIRHGALAAGCLGRYIGRTDEPLSPEGRCQAASLARVLEKLGAAHILASPLLRTRETAEIVIGRGGSYAIDDDLREIDFGRWERMSFSQIAEADPAAVERWAALNEDFAFPGGEDIAAFCRRVGAAADRIAADPAETVVAFTHGGVIRLLICRFLGLDYRQHLLFDVRPASVSEIRIEDGKGVLVRLNDCCHVEMS